MLSITWTAGIDNWIVLIGAICAMSCALLGCFLVLRQMSMMGDAISHAVLPGLAIAFLFTGSRASFSMLVGAAVAGLLTTLFTQWVRGFGRVDGGAAMGVVFTTLFAIGLIVLVRAVDHVDLDPDCVLYGAIELAPLDRAGHYEGDRFIEAAVFGTPYPRALPILLGVLALNLAVVGLFYKELKISSFDPELATALGFHANAMHYLLMILVAVTTVVAFEMIGSILVIAMLIVPPATAYLLTDRLGPMLILSMLIAAASAVLGHLGAVTLPGLFFEGVEATTTAGMMAVAAGACFAVALIVAPRHGLLSRLTHRAALARARVREDALGLLYRLDEHDRAPTADELIRFMRDAGSAPAVVVRLALRRLTRDRLITRDADAVRLADAGRAAAADLVRAHRLWETYLHRHLALPIDHVHGPAERLEHVTDPDLARALAQSIGHPTTDPQGKRITPRREA